MHWIIYSKVKQIILEFCLRERGKIVGLGIYSWKPYAFTPILYSYHVLILCLYYYSTLILYHYVCICIIMYRYVSIITVNWGVSQEFVTAFQTIFSILPTAKPTPFPVDYAFFMESCQGNEKYISVCTCISF